ncbi:GEVED domain-containing protein [Epilithonimonas vandammei]|nr:GEVED domain-containing protein [Epilithonimonas vandammei]
MKKTLLGLAFVALPMFGFAQTYFSDNFDDEDISDWTLYDQDGDGYNWETVNLGTGYTGAIASYSYDNASSSALTPNNYIVSPAINLSTATSAILKFKVKAQDPDWAAETYSVYVATTNTVAGLLATTPLLTENAASNGAGGVFYTKTIDLSAFAGQSQVYIAFRHYNSTDMFSIHIDDVSVAAAPTTAPGCAALTSPANGATNLAYLSQTLSWTAPTTGVADSYDVYLDKNTDPTTLVSTVSGTSYTAANLDPSSTYYWKVVAKNATGSATGCTVYSFTTMAPTYCTAGATSTSFEKISNVTFANINKNSTATAGYEDFTSTIGNVTAGQTYTFTASFTGTSYDQDHVLVWIDFNNDKDFNDAGEQVLVTATKKSPWTGSITIPAGATATTTRMRVRLNDSGSSTSNITPCGTSTFGQVEDYTLNIGALSVSDVNKADNIKAYPNPVKDVLKLEAAGNIKSVKVFDTTGKQIMTKELNEAKSQIDLSKLGTGVYVVTTTLADGTTTSTKVIKE